jgi:hypothetical protein
VTVQDEGAFVRFKSDLLRLTVAACLVAAPVGTTGAADRQIGRLRPCDVSWEPSLQQLLSPGTTIVVTAAPDAVFLMEAAKQ